ncbi:hypothetical protein [Rubrivirga sp. IMCC43871]|uniref:hypothetical protein n=1 Tax=Rubrivirga sp. IMCC43871 TaxID=3391575 RepID=UPI00398F952A
MTTLRLLIAHVLETADIYAEASVALDPRSRQCWCLYASHGFEIMSLVPRLAAEAE